MSDHKDTQHLKGFYTEISAGLEKVSNGEYPFEHDFTVPISSIPIVKEWENGQRYKLVIEVEQRHLGISDVGFRIKKIKPLT